MLCHVAPTVSVTFTMYIWSAQSSPMVSHPSCHNTWTKRKPSLSCNCKQRVLLTESESTVQKHTQPQWLLRLRDGLCKTLVKSDEALVFAQMHTAHQTSIHSLHPISLLCLLLSLLTHSTVPLCTREVLNHVGEGPCTGDSTRWWNVGGRVVTHCWLALGHGSKHLQPKVGVLHFLVGSGRLWSFPK